MPSPSILLMLSAGVSTLFPYWTAGCDVSRLRPGLGEVWASQRGYGTSAAVGPRKPAPQAVAGTVTPKPESLIRGVC